MKNIKLTENLNLNIEYFNNDNFNVLRYIQTNSQYRKIFKSFVLLILLKLIQKSVFGLIRL